MNIIHLLNNIAKQYGKSYTYYKLWNNFDYIMFQLIFGEGEAINVKVWLNKSTNKMTAESKYEMIVWKSEVYINDYIMKLEYQPHFFEFKEKFVSCKADELVGCYYVDFDKKTLRYIKNIMQDRFKSLMRICDGSLDSLYASDLRFLLTTREFLNDKYKLFTP